MTSAAHVQTVTWRDVKGQTAVMKFFYPAASTAAQVQPIIAKAVAISNAATESSRGISQANTGPARYGAQGDYENVEDKAVFVFQTDSGDILRISIPAPKKLIFSDDEETVNATQLNVAEFIAAVIGRVCNRDALPVATYVGGYRSRVRRRKQINIFTRNPQLTGQG